MATDYKKLQNGSDIRGVALAGVAGENVNLGTEEAKNLTLGFAKWLAQKTGKRTDELVVSIGHDSRISAAALNPLSLSNEAKRPAEKISPLP